MLSPLLSTCAQTYPQAIYSDMLTFHWCFQWGSVELFPRSGDAVNYRGRCSELLATVLGGSTEEEDSNN